MKVIQITDVHFKQEEPFFKAGCSLNEYILKRLSFEEAPFIFLDSGDRFHVSKETGRVNGEVVRFFTQVACIENCKQVLLMQGNHDIKENTGSALDVFIGIHPKINVIKVPEIFEFGESAMYLLPYMKPFSVTGYVGIKSYGDEDFHEGYWKSAGVDWEGLKSRIKLVSIHAGDETTGNFFMDVDISFLPGKRSNGHIHHKVSDNHLPSATVTRRDEIDKKCYIREIDTVNWNIVDVEIPLFLNYAQISYGDSLEDYFKVESHVLPVESLIVDITGHNDINLVAAEYSEKWKNCTNPRIYIGNVITGGSEYFTLSSSEEDSFGIGNTTIKDMFAEFCDKTKLSESISKDLMIRLGQ